MIGKSLNLTGVLYLMIALGLVVNLTPLAAQNPSGPAPQAAAGKSRPSAAPAANTSLASAAATPGTSNPLTKLESAARGKELRRVHLAIDGNLPGKVVRSTTAAKNSPSGARISMASAKPSSTRAKVWFLQAGQVVNEIKTDESGRFQVVGLRPGVYSAVAMGRDAAGVASIEVLPYQSNLPKEMTVLTISLAEPSEDEKPEETRDLGYVPSTGETMIGAGGGGMGGGGGMLGLAGLAAGMGGLAAGLGGGGGYVGPSSPNVP